MPESSAPSDAGGLSQPTATLAPEPTIPKDHGTGQIGPVRKQVYTSPVRPASHKIDDRFAAGQVRVVLKQI